MSGSKKAEEYRPISTLLIYENILEQVVKNQFLEYLDDNKILINNNQAFEEVTNVKQHYRIT